MRYRYNNVYEIVHDDESKQSQFPSNKNDGFDYVGKIDELFKLIEEQSEKLNELKAEETELFAIINNKLDELDEKINSLPIGETKSNNDVEIIMDELLLFKEKQEAFNKNMYEKVDDRIDRINEFIDFINDVKERLDLLDESNGSDDSLEELKNDFQNLNDRLKVLEDKLLNEEPIYKIDDLIEEINEENSKQIDSIKEDYNEAVAELEQLIQEQKEENEEIITQIKDDGLSYNENWLKEFEEMKLSLEDDGIYEYDVEDIGDEDMKHDYYNGELPKTKIVKVRSNDLVRNYDSDELNSFIGTEARKLASSEIDRLQSDSEVTQKAWLANNQRLNEMAAIIEKQEEEIKRLTANARVSTFNTDPEDVSNLVKREALKLIRDEYEDRIRDLELGKNHSDDDRIAALRDQLENERLENERLRGLLRNNEPVAKVEEPVVQPAPAPAPTFTTPVTESEPTKFVGAQRKKRKQKFFFEVKEHAGPKITKADLDKEPAKK